jgi:hypothetical protein
VILIEWLVFPYLSGTGSRLFLSSRTQWIINNFNLSCLYVLYQGVSLTEPIYYLLSRSTVHESGLRANRKTGESGNMNRSALAESKENRCTAPGYSRSCPDPQYRTVHLSPRTSLNCILYKDGYSQFWYTIPPYNGQQITEELWTELNCGRTVANLKN